MKKRAWKKNVGEQIAQNELKMNDTTDKTKWQDFLETCGESGHLRQCRKNRILKMNLYIYEAC